MVRYSLDLFYTTATGDSDVGWAYARERPYGTIVRERMIVLAMGHAVS